MIRPVAVLARLDDDGGYEVILVDADHRGFIFLVTRTRQYANYVCVALAWNQRVCAQPARPPVQAATGSP